VYLKNMNLIIVESPTKARTLTRFLGSGYSVEATMGHIKDLPKEKLSVDVENNFEPNYVLVAKKSDTVAKIQKEAKKASSIFIATDPDREGEAIAKHVEEILHKGKDKIPQDRLKRIVFHEITKFAVEEAIKKPGEVNSDLVDAQIARRVLDRLVGYKLSPLLWKKVRRGLSAGRVQSVAVRLIVEKEREIEAFKPEEYWEIFVTVKKRLSGESFDVKLIKIDGKSAKVEDEKTADGVVYDLKKSAYVVQDVKKREVKKSPYPPFTTSTMTQAAARIFSWSAKKTMSMAQKLYELGLITYHRTDSTNLSIQAVNQVRDFIDKVYGKDYLPESPRFYKTRSKLAQEAHEAIRPTNVNAKVDLKNSKFAGSEEKLYELIWKRFVACQMTNCVFDETTIDVMAKAQDTKGYLLRVSGQVMKFDGWRRVIPLSKEEAPELPDVEKGEVLDMVKVKSDQKFTQPPARYNEASLIKTLEKLGIGRPSTYAPIITTIQTRAYVEKQEGKFYPTPIGIAVTDFLVKNFSNIVDYSFTADMEKELDDIAQGQLEWRKMMGVFYGPFEEKVGSVDKGAERVKIEAEKLGKKCPTCEKEGRTGDKQGDLVIRTGRFGKFISCSNFPECRHTERYIERVNIKCPKCKKGDVIIKYTKSRRKFFGCSRYPKCKWASWKKPGGGDEKKNQKKE
jgi:DNA topoisomerase-1